MKILATVDFSIASEAVLKAAKTYATKMDADVLLVHAEPLVPAASDDDERDMRPEMVRLKKDAKALEKAGVRVTSVFVQGPVCESILDQAIRYEADLIITGAHGHGGPHCKVPVGHISECILLKSRIPVLVIPD